MNFEDDLGIKSFDDPKVPQSVRDLSLIHI